MAEIMTDILGAVNDFILAYIVNAGLEALDQRQIVRGWQNLVSALPPGTREYAVLTLLGDMLKAVIAVGMGYLVVGINAEVTDASGVTYRMVDQFGAAIAGLFVMLGHMFPVYYKFKGGKGVAVAAASMLMLNPSVFAIILVCFLVIVGGTKYVSLGSVMCAFLYPVFLKTMNDILFPYLYALGVTKIGPDVLFAVLIAVFVIFMHRENIKRFQRG
mgnify:CR=1 FL=1